VDRVADAASRRATVKQWLAVIRHLCDWLVTGQVRAARPGRRGTGCVTPGKKSRTMVVLMVFSFCADRCGDGQPRLEPYDAVL
jgi:hypothetical protein